MKELLTFQAGGNSNRLFVPFWNIQKAYFSCPESPLSEVLWSSPTVPRLLALDFKDRVCFPGVPLREEDKVQWKEEVKVYYQEPVRSWSSDLAFPLSPKNVLTGSREDFSADVLEDRIRVQTEQCDAPQGFLAACDIDWSWGVLAYAQLVADECPKLPGLLVSVKGMEGMLEHRTVAEYLVGLTNHSHLLHIPSFWSEHSDSFQRFGPAVLCENLTLPFRIPESPDMRQTLQPILLNSHSNLATSLVNVSETEQLLVGLEPSDCSCIQKTYRGRGHEIRYCIPPIEGWQRSVPEYETVYARSESFNQWLQSLAQDLRRCRDDEAAETFERLCQIADNYTSH